MKIKCVTAILFIGVAAILSGCNDDLTMVGSTIQPGEDRNAVYRDTFQITASTVKMDSLYAKTSVGLLGEIYDPQYGQLKSDYLCQFYCSDNYKFPHTPYNGVIDSMKLLVHFYSWTGDSLASMRATVYPINKPINKVYYTHIKPEDYCDMQNPLSSKIYTALNCPNLIATDTQVVRITSSNTYVYAKGRDIVFKLPTELGTKFYNETVNNPSSFANQSAFNEFFPGVYITTDYGSGNIIEVNSTNLRIYYKYAMKSSTGADSLLRDSASFIVTKEVTQTNRYQSSNDEQLLADNDDYVYIKTPAGIYPRYVIPTREIAKTTEGRILNNMTLSLKYMPQDSWKYALSQPSHILLMPEDSLHTFFENNDIENGITTYVSSDKSTAAEALYSSSGYNASARAYIFPNIVNLLSAHIKNKPDEDLRVVAIPVSRITSSSSYSGSTVHTTTAINNYLSPSGLKIRKDAESMQIILLSNKFN